MGDVVAIGSSGVIGDGASLDPDVVLERAKGQYAAVVVIGVDEAGDVAVCASEGSRETLWWLRRAEHHLLFETE